MLFACVIVIFHIKILSWNVSLESTGIFYKKSNVVTIPVLTHPREKQLIAVILCANIQTP